MSYGIYSKSLDGMPLILIFFENELTYPTGSLWKFCPDFKNNLKFINNFLQIVTVSTKTVIIRPEYYHCTSDNVRQKVDLCLTKFVSQRTQLPDVKLTNYKWLRCLKTQKHSVSMDLSCSGFSFYEHFSRQFTYSVFFIFIIVRYIWVKQFYTKPIIWDFLPCLRLLLCFSVNIPFWVNVSFL